jgi:hypothetical protein
MTAAATQPLEGCPADAAAILIDPEFAALWLTPSPDAQQMQQEDVFREGCHEPLYVWPWNGRLLLLTGFHLFETLRLYRLPFRVLRKEFRDREGARLFIARQQLRGQQLTPLAVRYLRGVRYQTEKRGSNRLSRLIPVGIGGHTAAALADLFGVSAATIRRDGELAAAVEKLVRDGGADRSLLLGQEAHLTWQKVVALSKLEAGQQRRVLGHLAEKKRLPRKWRADGPGQTVCLPRELQARATVIVRREGREAAETLAGLLREAAAAAGNKQGTAAQDDGPKLAEGQGALG